MSKHTPGPWKHEVHETDHRGTGVIWAQRQDWEPGMFTSPNNKMVAEVAYQTGQHAPWRGSEGEEFEANASLIAAAPDMLFILQDFIAAFPVQNQVDEVLIRRASELVAKAEGRS